MILKLLKLFLKNKLDQHNYKTFMVGNYYEVDILDKHTDELKAYISFDNKVHNILEKKTWGAELELYIISIIF